MDSHPPIPQEQLQRPPEQQTTEAEEDIRRLDNEVREAMLRSDVVALGRICSDDFVVTNPFNQIVNKQQVLDAVETGRIKHTSYERHIEYLHIYGDTAIVMGRERIVDAGPTIHRRYTEVWIKQSGRWQLVARHANLVQQ